MSKSAYNRREFMKAGLAGMAMHGLPANHGLVSSLQAAQGDTSGKKNRGRPNIILFFTDQQRLSALGAYGKTVCKTPVLDQLAAEGVLFENAYTSCPLCSPARASLITGKHIHAHRTGANTYEFGCNVSELPDTPALLPRKLQSAGYRCGYTGKWHIGNRTSLPSSVGFEGVDFPGHGGGGFGFPEYKAYLKKHGYRHRVRKHAKDGVKIRNYGVLEDVVESSVPYYLAEETISLIDQFDDAGEPFFIWHNNWGPHEPYYVPEKYYDMYRDVEIPEWKSYRWTPENPYGPDQLKRHPNHDELQWEDWAESIKHYYAFATLIDEQIGRVLEHLEKKGMADNTIIMFSSDHGETLGSHAGLTDKGWNHYEEIQHVGMIVKDPRLGKQGGQRGARVDKLVSTLDIYPTVLEYADARYDSNRIHGRSLVKLVEGKKTQWRDSVFVEFFGLGHMATNMITCRHGDIKYGYTCSNKDELYDLARDPHEMTNLLEDPAYAGIADMMRRRIYTFMVKTKYPGSNNFRLSRLGYSNERQYVHGPDPVDAKSFLVADMEI
ncbi:MAG: sulfatase-like hydrolase/transferase [Planctomycetes bacterium]|nr:sulfatase-like hydrolase/transferase [Planctomycetota bacterium]